VQGGVHVWSVGWLVVRAARSAVAWRSWWSRRCEMSRRRTSVCWPRTPRLREHLEQARRAGKRQAAPFFQGRPAGRCGRARQQARRELRHQTQRPVPIMSMRRFAGRCRARARAVAVSLTSKTRSISATRRARPAGRHGRSSASQAVRPPATRWPGRGPPRQATSAAQTRAPAASRYPPRAGRCPGRSGESR
jgi:hypothetical protein